jgi:hypothetical protein
MGRRSITVLALAGAMLAFPSGWASAGGSWLDTERPFYGVGEVVVAREHVSSGVSEGKVSDGPYYAYLVPEPRWFNSPGPVPDYAVPLGPMSIEPGTIYRWVATVEFTVPDVPTGRYFIQYCNDPCTVDGIGDLVGGSLFIGATRPEARLGWQVERLESRVDSLRQQGARKSDRVAALKRELADARSALSEQPALRVIPVPADAVGRDARPLVPGWAIVLLAVAVAGGAMLARRRQRLPVIPDTVPPELVDEVIAQVPLRQPATSGGSPGIVRASPGTPSSGGSPVTKS